jgi:hypothetical protein
MPASDLVEKTNDAAMVRLRLPFAPPLPLSFPSNICPPVVMLGVSASHLSEVPIPVTYQLLLPISRSTQRVTINNKSLRTNTFELHFII